MKLNALIAGVGMTRFGKHLDRGMKSLGEEAITMALNDAGVEKSAIQAAWMGNAAAGLITGQECIGGQVILRGMGIGAIPVINVENACASSSTAFEQAAAMVTAGLYDIVLAVGTEKLYHVDKVKTFSAFGGAVDVEGLAEIMADLKRNAEASGATAASDGAGKNRSMFMDIYASGARAHMEAYGTTAEQFAAVSAKNSFHGHLNERAQFREELTVEEVLAQPMIAEPLTRPMCSPIGDGAAAVVVVSEKKAREMGLVNPVKAVSSVLRSGWDHAKGDKYSGSADLCISTAYEEAAIGPEDLSLVELHDASAPSEIMTYDTLGLCAKGEGGILVESGATKLGGKIPVNTSGGLLRKGHPIGATGIAQLVELTEQLRGTAGARQVEGAKVGLAHNGGGVIGNDAAAMCVTILTR
ncbi:MAG: thiolase family protein [Gammaproteobacteria bacterium]|jgi:acetyl-CoA acetyltransferase|nr:thiolase family protein [Gammaproteobacteria bacterium]MBT4492660.1 thiolase family protein [Gammaproteobacteria bacterium]